MGHGWSEFALRTANEPSSVIADVRGTVREVLKTVPMEQITTMSEHLDAFIVPERLIAVLSGLFGGLGALLAAVGLYGLLTYRVALRIHEIGIRLALGATRSDVSRMVAAEALSMVCAGLAIGVLLTFWGKRFAANLIEGLPVDRAGPMVLGALAMIAIALLAAYVPTRRAAQVDPMEALRYE